MIIHTGCDVTASQVESLDGNQARYEPCHERSDEVSIMALSKSLHGLNMDIILIYF